MVKLSLCAIVKDEEACIGRCLDSVKEVVDQIVILDTGSRDRTVEIARDYGAQIEHYQWNDDFAAARNAALQYVTGDWVLVLDADEILHPEIVPQLQEAIASDRHLAINLVRQEIGAKQSPYSLVSRLFRPLPEIRFSRPYHALIDDSVAEFMVQQPDRWEIGYLSSVAIVHDGYRPEAIAARDKLSRIRKAMERYLSEHPDDAYTCSKLGALYVQNGEIEAGLKLLKKGLKQEKHLDRLLRYELHYHAGIALSKQQRIGKAKSHYEVAIALNILPALKIGAYNNLGNLYMQTGDLTGAIAAYERVWQIDPNLPIAHFNLGLALKEKGKINEAIAAYYHAIELDPTYAETYQNIAVILLKNGKVFESLDHFRKAIALYEQRDSPAGSELRTTLKEMGFKI
ncbi:tetratricopeptide repeat protein [Oxynema sp. CENA135]|uniref:glycosyltransferase n=1 Tax=Oxynema sp. CENA135 TaxID=984206 RepID=UPI00190C371A|nr:glycosyltransferase [Oxynema sp. CENA135]MBK4732315.1 tetratricopeptide repeat protein [Oxynema sp. CENA135]